MLNSTSEYISVMQRFLIHIRILTCNHTFYTSSSNQDQVLNSIFQTSRYEIAFFREVVKKTRPIWLYVFRVWQNTGQKIFITSLSNFKKCASICTNCLMCYWNIWYEILVNTRLFRICCPIKCHTYLNKPVPFICRFVQVRVTF